MTIDKVLHDVLNAGIALFRAGEDSVANAAREVQRTFDQLKDKGAADTSEGVVKLRKALDDIVLQTNDLSSKAGVAYTDAITQLETLYAKLVEQIKTVVPEDQLNQLKDKIDELQRVIKEKTGRGGATA